MKESIKHNLRNAATVMAGAIGYIGYYRKALFRVLLFPLAFVMVLNLVSSLMPHGWSMVGWALMALGFLVCCLMAVSIHRVLILGPESLPKWGLTRLSARELRFAVYLFALIVLSRAAMLPTALMVYLPVSWLGEINVFAIIITWGAIIGFLIARLYLVFPGTAVERGLLLRDSWRLTRPHALMIFIVGVLIPQLSFMVLDVLWELPVIRYTATLLVLAWLGFTVAMLSVAYKVIMGSSDSCPQKEM